MFMAFCFSNGSVVFLNHTQYFYSPVIALSVAMRLVFLFLWKLPVKRENIRVAINQWRCPVYNTCIVFFDLFPQVETEMLFIILLS